MIVAIIAIAFLSSFPLDLFSQVQLSELSGQELLTIDDAPEMQVIAISKNVIILKNAKAVLVWGGDVVVEGRVEGDVAAIGGSVIQKEGGFIGGDVIVLGGQYRAEAETPLRIEGKQTVMIGMFEDELRSVAADPTQLFSTQLTASFLIQRILSVLFWFLVTLGAATIAPGAVGRAISSIQLSPLKIAAAGSAVFILMSALVIAGLGLLPEAFAAITGLMVFVMIMAAYAFGRVAVHVLVGRCLLRYFWPELRSDSVAILAGVFACTVFLSIPYLWPLVLFVFFAIGCGIVINARRSPRWSAE